VHRSNGWIGSTESSRQHTQDDRKMLGLSSPEVEGGAPSQDPGGRQGRWCIAWCRRVVDCVVLQNMWLLEPGARQRRMEVGVAAGRVRRPKTNPQTRSTKKGTQYMRDTAASTSAGSKAARWELQQQTKGGEGTAIASGWGQTGSWGRYWRGEVG
jgi:hypothetical protein